MEAVAMELGVEDNTCGLAGRWLLSNNRDGLKFDGPEDLTIKENHRNIDTVNLHVRTVRIDLA